jgi:hypothetical protein
MFGAKLNGLDDDTKAIKDCHDFANLNNLRVEQHSGTIYMPSAGLTYTVQVKTGMDLTGCEIKINETMGNRTLFNIIRDTDAEDVTSVVNKSELTEGTRYIPSLSLYKNSIFYVTSDELFAYRGGDTNQPMYKTDIITVLTKGYILDGGLQHNFTTGNINVRRYSIDDKPITLKGFKVNVNTSDSIALARVLEIQRSNVTLQDFSGIITNMPVMNNSNYTFKNAMIHIMYSYNVNFNNISTENFGGLTENSTDATQGQYVWASSYSSNLNMSNINCVRGWGAMNSENTKNISISNAILNRIDAHWGHDGIALNDITIIGNNSGVCLGWGKGKVTINNFKQIITSSLASNTSYYTEFDNMAFIQLRNDFGVPFEGNVVANDIEIIFTKNLDNFNLINGTTSTVANTCYRDVKFPNIKVSNVRLINENSSTINLFRQIRFYIPSGVSKNIYGNRIHIENVYGDFPTANKVISLINDGGSTAIIQKDFDFVMNKTNGFVETGVTNFSLDANKCKLSFANDSTNAFNLIKLKNSKMVECVITPTSYNGNTLYVVLDSNNSNNIFLLNLIEGNPVGQPMKVIDSLFKTIPSTYSSYTFDSCRYRQGSGVSIPIGTLTSVPFNAALYDSNSMLDGTNPTRILIKKDGVYDITAGVVWQSNTVGYRQLEIRKNASEIVGRCNAVPISGNMYQQVSGSYKFASGDYVELYVTQTSDSVLSLFADSTNKHPFIAVNQVTNG